MATPAQWDNRIVKHADVPPEQLLANPKNYRRHTRAQKDALRGLIAEVGYIDPILCQLDDTVIDGHLRVEVALEDGIATVPVDYYDGTQAQSDLILASKDPLAAMAYHDAEQLRALLDEVSTGDAAVMAMLSDLAEDAGVIPPDWSDAMGGLPDGEKSPFEQMTFTVSARQATVIRDALTRAKHGTAGQTDNENSNGNALAVIAEAYLDAA